MITQSVSRVAPASPVLSEAAVYVEGMLAGAVGAAVIALWFLAIDFIEGHPFYTPAVLGSLLFGGTPAVAGAGAVVTSFETVVSFTWIHALVFLLIGMGAAKLLDLAEHNPNLGFGVILLFVFFQCAFMEVSMVLADGVLHGLAWPSVMGGNLVAAAAMAWILWRRHPDLVINP